ncbi:MFS transporter [Leifsonia sp. 2TAF2]|uniref:MFS transporter n=1 Tax=Leifsonia sp. 2TAF2 TaxID=3233009 RepID=UPI003F9671EB
MAGRWGAVTALGAAQFVMVLDSTVMNVSISQVVSDLDTTIAVMQSAITFYTLTMAAFMLLGAKLGERWGRRRALVIGSIIYSIGSATTALSVNAAMLVIGWSVVEGLGAVLVIPAIAGLIADNYSGHARVTAFSIIGAASGVAVAVGPLVGGFVTTYASWRYVFAAEVVVMAVVLIFNRVIRHSGEPLPTRIDVLSVILSALALFLIVYGLLQTKTWGWILPTTDTQLLGLSPVPFIVAAGAVLLWVFLRRQGILRRSGRTPFLNTDMLTIRHLRAGVGSIGLQYTVTAGLFFIVPVYLQFTLGLNAVNTGIRLFPLSVALVLFSIIGTALARRLSPKRIARIGQLLLVLASLVLLFSIDPELQNGVFATGMFLAGAALGLLASQLGNVTMSAVDRSELSEAGGVQGVFQNLGSSLGTAILGSIMIAALGSLFLGGVAASALPHDVQTEVTQRTESGVPIVAVSEVPRIAKAAGLSDEQGRQLTDLYQDAQLQALRLSFAVLTLISISALAFSRNLPSTVAAQEDAPAGRTGPSRDSAPAA